MKLEILLHSEFIKMALGKKRKLQSLQQLAINSNLLKNMRNMSLSAINQSTAPVDKIQNMSQIGDKIKENIKHS